MTDTTAAIKSKGLESTGVTEQLARSYANQLGTHHLAIVEYRVDSVMTDADGHRKVALALTQVEPVVDGDLNGKVVDHVREIQRVLWRNRGEDEPIEGVDGPEPTVADVLQHGEALLEHDEETGAPSFWDGQTDQADEQPPEGYDGNDDADEPAAASDDDGLTLDDEPLEE